MLTVSLKSAAVQEDKAPPTDVFGLSGDVL